MVMAGNGYVTFAQHLRRWIGVKPSLAAVSLCMGYMPNTALQSQKAVSAHFTSKQILPFWLCRAEYSRRVLILYIQ